MAKGLVLAGGGAKGSYQVGAYRALCELGWQPDIITGASVGCLNAALFALGKEREAAELWQSLDVHGVLEVPQGKSPEELRGFLLDVIKGGGLNLEPLGETIDRYLSEADLRAAKTRYGLVLTEMNTLRSVQCALEDIPQGELKAYMLGSSSCFPALRPREIHGVRYIDGGWRDNMPLELAQKMGATELVGIDVDGIGYTRPNTTGLPTRIIRSHWDLGPLFEFDGERAGRNIALGYLDTMRAFGRMGGTAYAILPAADGFWRAFAASYRRVLAGAIARAPTLALTEAAARAAHRYPPAFEKDPAAPTAGALAPLELAAETVGVSPERPFTPKLLAFTFLGSFTRDPADQFRALLGSEPGPIVGELAQATASPEAFVTAAVSSALGELRGGLYLS